MNLNKYRKAELIAMIKDLRAENVDLRSQNEELRVGSVAANVYVQELRAEIQDLRAEPAPAPAPQPVQPQRRGRDLSGLRAAALAYRTTSKFDEHGNIVVFVRGAWHLA